MTRFAAALALLFALAGLPALPQPLLHYRCDEGQGARVLDSTSNALHGASGAGWAASPSGGALAMSGEGGSIVTAQIPADLRLGTGSWSFTAWLKPRRFDIDDRQNQRRVLAYGAYPDAYMVIDLLSTGHLSWYFTYRNAAGHDISAGGSSAAALKLDQWAFVALVCDRQKKQVTAYIDGMAQSAGVLPAQFDGDFSLNGELTLGSEWHNYDGLMDEPALTRAALTRAQVKAEFARLAPVFGVKPSAEAAAAERRETLMETLAKAKTAWEARDWRTVRATCAQVAAAKEATPALSGAAHLCAAQSFVGQGDLKAARAEYARIAATARYEPVHRAEAAERVRELARAIKGLPERDPAATRTSVPAIAGFAAQVAVSPKGSDAADGMRKPVATLNRARDLVRALRRKGVKGAIAVDIAPGEYPVTAPLALTKQDSGTAAGPVVYRATRSGKAVFYGGKRITGFVTVTDEATLARLPEEGRGRVIMCDLKAQGITDTGQLAVRGFSQPPSPPTLELFVDRKPMTLARWPNTGFVPIRRLVEPGSRAAGKPSVFEYVDDRHARWTQAADAWLFGYFRYLWADATIAVTGIDAAARTVTCGEAYQYGEPGMDTGQGIQYYAFNLLEEIDQPGEWYLDRAAGILYLYPPTDLAKATVELGMISTPMVTAEGVRHVRFEGLAFDLGRHNGLVLENCSDCLVAGCTVSRMAGNGITVDGGTRVGLLGCDVHTIGRRATEVIGGDRATLKPGRHFVENCRIHDFGRIDRTYTPAIQLEGVGNRVAHNLMYDCPSSVMRIEGNDHVIEFNDVRRAVLESDDQGAMELFGNPTYRGVVFRHNRFTDCGKAGGGAQVHGQAAIRFDDAISGMLVYGNVFIRSANGNFGAIQLNSGRDNWIDNNLFIECTRGVSGGWYPFNSVWKQVAEKQQPAVLITSDLYLKRYPEMAWMLKDPGINHVWRSVFVGCGPTFTGNPAHLDLMMNTEAAAKAKPAVLGFRPIPIAEIGLYADRFRGVRDAAR